MATQLPLEVLQQIVEAVLPVSLPVAFTADDVVTRTLVSLTMTCRSLWPISCRLLYRHCLDITSPRKLKCVLRSLQSQRVQDALARPPVHALGLYLSPYPDWNIHVSDTAEEIQVLFAILAKDLQRLVIDIPLRSLYPEQDHRQCRPILRSAFSQLKELKEFTSVQDELYLSLVQTRDTSEEEVWTLWPKLERLALYNVDAISLGALHNLPRATALKQLVLTRADGIEWETADEQFNVPKTLRELKVLEVGLASPPRSNSLRSRLHGYIKVPYLYDINIPVPETWDFEDPISLAQDFVAYHARAGTLWDMKNAPSRYASNIRRTRP